MKYILAILLAYFVSLSAFAEVWQIDGRQVSFTENPKYGKLARCGKDQEKPKCQAMAALSRVTLPPKKKARPHDENPAAVLCKKSGGKPVTGLDPHDNENGFCQFSDKSIISAAGLYSAAARNSQIRTGLPSTEIQR